MRGLRARFRPVAPPRARNDPVRAARDAGLDVPTRKITFRRSDLEHAVRRGRGKRPRRVLDAADLDRVPEIVRRPMAVLQDRPNGTLVYVGRAADGRRLVKVVIRTGRTRDL